MYSHTKTVYMCLHLHDSTTFPDKIIKYLRQFDRRFLNTDKYKDFRHIYSRKRGVEEVVNIHE